MGLAADALHDWRPDAAIESVEEPAAGLGLGGIVRLATVDGEEVVVHVRDTADPSIDPAVKRVVRKQTGVPVPRVLHEGSVDGRAYDIEARVPGTPFSGRFVALGRDAQERVLRRVGGMIAAVHDQVAFAGSGRLARDDGVHVTEQQPWPDLLRGMMDTELAGMRETRFADLVPTVQDAFADGMETVPTNVDAVLLHNDLGPSNVLGDNTTVTGIVDWANAVAGDPVYDVVRAERSFIDKRIVHGEQEALRAALYDGYREQRPFALPGGRRDMYRLACSLEVLRWFPRWSASLDEETVRERARFWTGFVQRLCNRIREGSS